MLDDKAGEQREQFTQILSCKFSEQMYRSMFLYEASTVGLYSRKGFNTIYVWDYLISPTGQ